MKIGDSRINEAEERISGDRLVAIRAMEKNVKKKKKQRKEKRKLTDCLRDCSKQKHTNNYAIVVPEGEGREKRPQKIFFRIE